jgi:hypothetical protein
MISERQGEESSSNKHRGKISFSNQGYVINKTKYLVSADPCHKNYRPGERVALVESSNVLPFFENDDPGLYAERLVQELYEWTDKYRGNKKPPKDVVVDRVISFSPDDDVSPEQAMAIAKQAVEAVMGPLDSRFSLFVVHAEKDHLHVHFLASTVDQKGKVFNPREDDKIWNKQMDRLEQKYDLTQVGSRDPAAKKKPTNKELQRKKRTGEPAFRELHQDVLDAAVDHANGDFMQFIAMLAANNMIPISNMSSSESKIRGMSFSMNGVLLPGGELGTSYRWGHLQKRIGFDDENQEHKEALYDILTAYNKESEQECSTSPEGSSPPSPALYDDVETLLDMPPEQTTDFPMPKGKPVDIDLYRVFNHEFANGDIIYSWKPRRSEAFREVNDAGQHRMITKNGLNKTVCTAMCQRALELGWSGIKVAGSAEYKANMVKIASRHNLRVVDENGIEMKHENNEPKAGWGSLSEYEQNRVKQLAELHYKSTNKEAIDKVLPGFLEAKVKVDSRHQPESDGDKLDS